MRHIRTSKKESQLETSAVGGEAVFSVAECIGPAVALAASTSSGGGELAATPSSSGDRNCASSVAADI